jgi:hypothetical protein
MIVVDCGCYQGKINHASGEPRHVASEICLMIRSFGR